MENVKSSLIFKEYIVDEVSFKLNRNFEEKPVELKVDIQSSITKDDNNMEVNLKVDLFKDISDKKLFPFTMTVTITGMFQIENNTENITFDANAVAILYPYVRAIISSYTANANINPVILPTLNVAKAMNQDNK